MLLDLILWKGPVTIPLDTSAAKWMAITVGIFLLFAIILGLIASSKKKRQGGYWREWTPPEDDD